jgi:hypothetical protein
MRNVSDGDAKAQLIAAAATGDGTACIHVDVVIRG